MTIMQAPLASCTVVVVHFGVLFVLLRSPFPSTNKSICEQVCLIEWQQMLRFVMLKWLQGSQGLRAVVKQ